MANLFMITLLASILILPIGLIRPSIFKSIFKTVPKRKNIVLSCIGVIIISFVGFGIFAPHTEVSKPKGDTVNQAVQPSSPQTDNTNASADVPDMEPTATVAPDQDDQQHQVPINEAAVAPQTPPVANDAGAGAETNKPAVSPTDQYAYYAVSSVVDGDTVKVSMNGSVVTLRLIGMDTPETVDPRKVVQCFGKEASDKAKELLAGKKIRIEKDASQGELDIYGRTLAYVYREDGLFFNKYMIEQGYAHEYTYNLPYKYQTEFKAAQKSARDNLLGLWSPDTCNGDTTKAATAVSTVTPQPAQPGGHIYYLSTAYNATNYYCDTDSVWKTLSTKNLKSYSSEQELLKYYPTRKLHEPCK